MKIPSCFALILGVVVSLSPVSWGQTQTVTASYNGLPLFIANDGADTISVASLIVPNALKVTNLMVRLQISYPNVSDLEVFLFSPFGTRVILLDNNCSNVVNVDTTFDDAAPQNYRDFCPTEAGRGPFRAHEPLSNVYADDSSFGTWRIVIENNSSDSRTGWLSGASLNITGTPVLTPTIRQNTVLNAANLKYGGIAPGELLVIAGVGLGPTAAMTAPAGTLPTTLGGTTVTFNGTPVPIGFTSPFLTIVQAPMNLTSGSPVSIQVSFNNVSSNVVMPMAQDTAPGIFTVEQGGQGQAKAINLSNNTLNTTVSRAAKGSFITVYATGLGAVNPPAPAGQVTPDSPVSTIVTTDIAASIGGEPAVVTFAGLAPGLRGYYQVNLQVPQTAPSGAQELTISAGGNASQSGAIVHIE
ncbi:MAG: proprotein convertase P-domain-containing protein [Bryobacteraceae bacterium]